MKRSCVAKKDFPFKPTCAQSTARKASHVLLRGFFCRGFGCRWFDRLDRSDTFWTCQFGIRRINAAFFCPSRSWQIWCSLRFIKSLLQHEKGSGLNLKRSKKSVDCASASFCLQLRTRPSIMK